MSNGHSNAAKGGKSSNAPTGQKAAFHMPERIHLIMHTDSIKSSDVNTFADAAKVLKADYESAAAYKLHEVRVVKVRSGKDIVDTINATTIKAKSILSLDIVSHGNQGGVHIARKLASPIEASFLQKRWHVALRANSDHPQTATDAEFMEESMHGLYDGWAGKRIVAYYYNQAETDDSNDIRYISDLQFDNFADDAFVEFHGCRTGEIIPEVNWFFDNFAKNFSDKLPENCRVVGHTVNAFPNKNPSGKSSDYRHGKVRVYKGGGKLLIDAQERFGLKFQNSSTPP